MTFEQLLNDPLLKIPKSNIYEGDFVDYIKEVLEKFEVKIDSLVGDRW